MDIFPQDTIWMDPGASQLFRIISSDLLSVTLQPLMSETDPVTKPMIDLLDLERIIESTDQEWYESDCNLFL